VIYVYGDDSADAKKDGAEFSVGALRCWVIASALRMPSTDVKSLPPPLWICNGTNSESSL
jgi:hypothetical protein